MNERKILKIGICCLVILCLVLSGIILVQKSEERRDQKLYMEYIYSELNEVEWFTENMIKDDTTKEQKEEQLVYLSYQLRNIAEELEDGYHFVSEEIPSVVSTWFYEKSSDILNSEFVTAQGEFFDEGLSFLRSVHSKIKSLIEPMRGQDQLNLDKELSIDDFSTMLLEFYRNQ